MFMLLKAAADSPRSLSSRSHFSDDSSDQIPDPRVENHTRPCLPYKQVDFTQYVFPSAPHVPLICRRPSQEQSTPAQNHSLEDRTPRCLSYNQNDLAQHTFPSAPRQPLVCTHPSQEQSTRRQAPVRQSQRNQEAQGREVSQRALSPIGDSTLIEPSRHHNAFEELQETSRTQQIGLDAPVYPGRFLRYIYPPGTHDNHSARNGTYLHYPYQAGEFDEAYLRGFPRYRAQQSNTERPDQQGSRVQSSIYQEHRVRAPPNEPTTSPQNSYRVSQQEQERLDRAVANGRRNRFIQPEISAPLQSNERQPHYETEVQESGVAQDATSPRRTRIRRTTVRWADDPIARTVDQPERATGVANSLDSRRAPVHDSVRITRDKAKAIRHVLEENLRKPRELSPFLAEEFEPTPMSALTGGPAGATRTTNGGSQTTPGRTVRSALPSGVPTPQEVLIDRQARINRQRAAEAEAAAQAEAERRQRPPQRSGFGAVQATRDSGYRSAGMTPGGRTAENPYDPRTWGQGQTDPRRRSAGQPSQQQSQQQPSQRQEQQRPQAPEPTRGDPSFRPQQSTSERQSAAQDPNVSSFPHAFERWERMSSYWEGLTSYWIHKLEQNIQDDATTTQKNLSRQINDLSAAGANLFHAVVELQRLRASSERKFQRWFFDTRSQIEASQEREAELQQALEDAQNNVQTSRSAMETEEFLQQSDRLAEMKRELAISKEEARRAWEELGRREQDENDRTNALRAGRAIEIGGVQVLPTSGVSRGGSLQRPTTQEGQYQAPFSPGADYDLQGPSPTSTDPFTESAPPPIPSVGGYAQRPANMPTGQPTGGPSARPTPGQFYTHQDTFLQGQGAYPTAEEMEDVGYELDGHGNVRIDASGQPIPFRRALNPTSADYDYQPVSPVTSSPPSQGQYASYPPDYSGEGFGSGQGWANIQRHEHPSRLSNVPEEEEEGVSPIRPSRPPQTQPPGGMF